MPATGQPRPNALLEAGAVLPPEAACARQARRLVRAVLAEAGRSAWADAAELAVSEVVTNAALHAGSDLSLRVQVFDDEVCVHVHDDSTRLPIARDYDDKASTGRGLDLVAAVSRACGAEAGPDGKRVWFCIGDELADGDLDAQRRWTADAVLSEPPATEEARPGATRVELQAMPATLWLSAREHHDAILRELSLLHADQPVEGLDLHAALQARSIVSDRLIEELRREERAGRTRPPLPDGHPSPLPWVPRRIDLTVDVDPSCGATFTALQDALDAAEALAVSGELLSRPGLPEIIAVRDWACEQVIAQLAGSPPSPWPGTAQERFETDSHGRPGPVWDAATVSASPQSLVAADEANRIVAVSASFAALSGWDPAELVGRRVVTLIPDDLREAHVAGFTRHLTTGEAHVLGLPLELPLRHRDGHSIACHFLVDRAPGQHRIYLARIDPVTGGREEDGRGPV